MNKTNTSLFNMNQQRALAALGLPLWHQRVNQVEQQSTCCYRLGQWLLIPSRQLPVTKPQWLVDLALALNTPISELAEISSRQMTDWPQHYRLPIMLDETEGLDAQHKRELWRHLAANC